MVINEYANDVWEMVWVQVQDNLATTSWITTSEWALQVLGRVIWTSTILCRPTGFCIPRFRNWHDDKRDYLRGFGYQGSASRGDWRRGVRELGLGANFKDSISKPGPGEWE